jgi:DNA-directed RNA polymerase subunit RPC12/RpoP
MKSFGVLQEQMDMMRVDINQFQKAKSVDTVDSRGQIANLAPTVRQRQAETAIAPEQIKCYTCKDEISKKKNSKSFTCGKCNGVSHQSCSTNEVGNLVCLRCGSDLVNLSTDIKNITEDSIVSIGSDSSNSTDGSADNPEILDGTISTESYSATNS